jgi:uncharacterized membrane protein HdeD (DUF308 family)
MEIVIGAVLIMLGFVAITLPVATSMAAVLVLGWALVAAGFAHLIAAVRSGSTGDLVTKSIVGIAYLAVAVAILRHPLWGVASLAVVVCAVMVLDGLATIVAYFVTTDESGSSLWLLVNGVITLLLGFVVWNLATTRPVLLISALVAINFVASGTARILTALAAQRLRKAIGA